MADGPRKLPDWFPNVNALWGAVLAETFYRAGLRYAVISPGSRSTPLTCALATHPGIKSMAVLDERSSAFLALGIAKRTGQPALLLCTSGTAGAHYYPAIIEARESNVPMLVITADRPPEMRNCASGQTIDQLKLFGGYPVFQAELAVPETTPSLLRYLRQTLLHAYAKTLGPIAGPVHLNAPFRDPLAPDKVGEGIALDLATLFEVEMSAPANPEARPLGVIHWPAPLASFLDQHGSRNGILIVGPQTIRDEECFLRNLGILADLMQAPLLADGLGPVRSCIDEKLHPITAYDLILRNDTLAERLRPDYVVQIGPLPTSVALRKKLAEWQLPTALVSPQGENLDPVHARTTPIAWDMASHMAAIPTHALTDDAYVRDWEGVEARAAALLTDALSTRSGADGIFEGSIIRHLAETLPQNAVMFIANSMPVRDTEYLWPRTHRGHRIYYNRGANGIDGTISTALGLACTGDTVWLVTGDLAFLHDTNGLLAHRQVCGRLRVLLINNSGGGIFGHLPIARHETVFEEYFATPQTISFADLARAHGCDHFRVTSLDAAKAAITSAIASEDSSKLQIIEIITNRSADSEWRRTTFRKLAAELV
ncbi:MAG: 2-succinyl-5-enolpyruvyl-6-hydroxy-3-cyclohexene-1-carboxylic-acid synthase [Verrucomicrobiota bacterium]|nr:2-succinyl-5-enolpyruvyl-6-hydroxy-3-cyclohexene-1-carboxylic-acid synthase [Verrucomicrobiota bacterium]